MKISQLLLEKVPREGIPTQKQVASYLGKIYPEEKENKLFADHWGLFSKIPNSSVNKILLCTTPTSEIGEYFKKNGYDLLISHHDFMIGVPQIIFHSIMDEGDKGHNTYFAFKLGLKNVIKRQVSVEGSLPKPMSLDEFKLFLKARGFNVNGLVWKRSQNEKDIRRVSYCSGLGGMLINKFSLRGMEWDNTEFDMTDNPADCYVTGELMATPKKSDTKFKYIIELGHTSSEKPLFKWIKNTLLNRWEGLQIDFAPLKMDYFGRDFLGNGV